MRQMNELFNKHERVWFSLLGEESQRQFLQAIHDYDPASTATLDQIGRHMAYGTDKQLRYVSWLVHFEIKKCSSINIWICFLVQTMWRRLFFCQGISKKVLKQPINKGISRDLPILAVSWDPFFRVLTIAS